MLHHFQGKDFLKLADFTPEEAGYFVDTAIELKRKRATGEVFEPLRGKTFAMIFEKLSTRTRVSFQAGAAQLGAQTLYMSPDQMQTSPPIRVSVRVRVKPASPIIRSNSNGLGKRRMLSTR